MFLTALLLSAAFQPDRWLHVGRSPGVYDEYFDKQSVTRSGDKVTLWTRRDSARGKVTLWHEIELNCSTRTETILAYIRDDGGKVSHNSVRPHRKASPIRPKSVGERLLKLACR